MDRNVSHLREACNVLQRDSHAINVLKIHYMSVYRNIINNDNDSIENEDIVCKKCGCYWNNLDLVTVRSEKRKQLKRSSKRLLNNNRTKFGRNNKIINKCKRKSNSIVKTCHFCQQKSRTMLPQFKKTNYIENSKIKIINKNLTPSTTLQNLRNNSSKKKSKRRSKSKFAGLNPNAVLSLTPNKTPEKSSNKIRKLNESQLGRALSINTSSSLILRKFIE